MRGKISERCAEDCDYHPNCIGFSTNGAGFCLLYASNAISSRGIHNLMLAATLEGIHYARELAEFKRFADEYIPSNVNIQWKPPRKMFGVYPMTPRDCSDFCVRENGCTGFLFCSTCGKNLTFSSDNYLTSFQRSIPRGECYLQKGPNGFTHPTMLKKTNSYDHYAKVTPPVTP